MRPRSLSAARIGGSTASIAATRAAALATSCSSPMPASRRTVRQPQRLLLIDQAPLGDGLLLLKPAQLEVVARHLRDHAHAHIVEVRLEAVGVGGGRLHGRAHAAEEVELPERVEAKPIGADRLRRSSENPGICLLAPIDAGRSPARAESDRAPPRSKTARAWSTRATAMRTSRLASSARSISASSTGSSNWLHHRRSNG